VANAVFPTHGHYYETRTRFINRRMEWLNNKILIQLD
jgi:hypothetical protein